MVKKMNDTTILYYSSNQEKPEFEKFITDDLIKKANGLPIISISQKPMDLGTNICVGDVGCSDHNIFSQIRRGCQLATTKYVAFAESDCLYPEDYFDYVPTCDNRVHLDTNLFILYKGTPHFKGKDYSLCGTIVGREYMLDCINKMNDGKPEWNWKRKKFRPMWHKLAEHQWIPFKTENAIINIKTTEGMRLLTGTNGHNIKDLPYWGSTEALGNKIWKL
jgi:hypothetical protein